MQVLKSYLSSGPAIIKLFIYYLFCYKFEIQCLKKQCNFCYDCIIRPSFHLCLGVLAIHFVVSPTRSILIIKIGNVKFSMEICSLFPVVGMFFLKTCFVHSAEIPSTIGDTIGGKSKVANEGYKSQIEQNLSDLLAFIS